MDIGVSRPVWTGDSTACPELYREYLSRYDRYVTAGARAWAVLSEWGSGGQFGNDDVGRFVRGQVLGSVPACAGGSGAGRADVQPGLFYCGVGSHRGAERGGCDSGVDQSDCGGRAAGSHPVAAGGVGGVGADAEQGAGDARSSKRDLDVDEGVQQFGKHHARNKARREKEKKQKKETKMREGWRGSVDSGVAMPSGESASGSAQTVDTRTGVEIEAAQTLAARRVAENKLKILEAKAAAKLVEHRLRALNDKERTLVIDRLAAARLEEKINTSKKKSQDSFKGCDSPIESVGSALSAHEFAFKQQVRKIEAQKVENKYKDEQLRKFYQYASPDVRQMVAEIPEPYIPTDEEMEAEDLDQSPEPTDEEMEAEAARYFS